MYVQVSPFEARKRGAALVARNIAAHIEREVFDKPRDWQPLLYCWRGGQRSGSLALVLGQIGFRVHLLEGGYKAWRRAMVAELDELAPRIDWRVICGKTGSGKSRLLLALKEQGAQVLDLEQLACHKGSVLGDMPGESQPSQKRFETLLWQSLRGIDASRPVFVEGESKKIGKLQVPDSLIERMRASPVLRLELPMPERVKLLMEDYDYFVRDSEALARQLDALTALRGKALVEGWKASARSGRMAEVVEQLLVSHYDPVYLQSMQRSFSQYGQAIELEPASAAAPDLAELAARLNAT
jgi:tRNA 2-selenouridine synthase